MNKSKHNRHLKKNGRATSLPFALAILLLLSGIASSTAQNLQLSGNQKQRETSDHNQLPSLSLCPDTIRQIKSTVDAQDLLTDKHIESTSDTDNYKSLVERGDESMLRGHWLPAISAYKMALDISHKEFSLIRKLAICSALAGRYDQSAPYFDKVIRLHPTDIPLLAGYAQVLIRMNDFSKARYVLAAAKDMAPKDFAVNYALSTLLAATARGGTPEDKCLSTENELRAYWDKLSVTDMCRVAKWLKGDRQALEKTITPDAFNHLCQIILTLKTAKDLDSCTQLLFTTHDAFINEDWENARKMLELCKKEGLNTLGVRMDMSLCELRTGDTEKALETIRKTTSNYPENPVAWYNLGYILFDIKDYSAAIEAFEKSNSLGRPNIGTLFATACALTQCDRMDECFAILKRLATNAPRQLKTLMDGNEETHIKIKQDPRYSTIYKTMTSND